MRSSRVIILVILSSLIISGRIANLSAEEGLLEGSPVEVSADVAIYSKYIWRGFELDGDPVMQQGIYIGIGGFTAGVWESFDIDNDDSLNSDELDYVIDYTHQFDNFSLSLGHTYYDFPATDAASREFYVGVGLNIPLSPTVTWYHDYGEEDSGGGDGDYVVLELGHSFALTDTVSLDLSGHVGYNNELFINGDGADVAFGAGLTFPLTEKITFSPNINYSIPFGDLEDSDDGDQNDEFYGGFTLAFSF